MRSSKCNGKKTMKSRQIEMANELEKGGSTMAFHTAKQRAKEKKRYNRHAIHPR